LFTRSLLQGTTPVPCVPLRFRSATLALAALVAVVPFTCRAATISSSVSLPITDAPFSNVSLSSLQQFDPAAGTLTQVLISVATDGVEQGTVKNNGTSPTATISVTVGTEMFLDSTDSLVDSLITGNDYGDLTGTQLYFGLAAGATANVGPFTLFDYQSQAFSSGLTPFLGVGSLGLELGAVNTFTHTGGSSIATANFTAQEEPVVTVTYTFTPSSTTPEPASLSFVLLGAAILAGKRWSSNRNIRKRTGAAFHQR
jgi:hypothetical protein